MAVSPAGGGCQKYKRICKKGVIMQLGNRGNPLMDPHTCVQKWLQMHRPERREKEQPGQACHGRLQCFRCCEQIRRPTNICRHQHIPCAPNLKTSSPAAFSHCVGTRPQRHVLQYSFPPFFPRLAAPWRKLANGRVPAPKPRRDRGGNASHRKLLSVCNRMQTTIVHEARRRRRFRTPTRGTWFLDVAERH